MGNLDGKKSVSLSGRVRNDLTEGYYKVPVVVLRKVSDGGFEQLGYEDLQIWISKGTGTVMRMTRIIPMILFSERDRALRMECIPT